MPANKRNVVAEFLPVHFEQPMAVAVFFHAHVVQRRGGRGEIGFHGIREIPENARILFLQGNS